MSIKAEAFVRIEESLTARITEAVEPVLASAWLEVKKQLDAQDYDAAKEVAAGIDLLPALRGVEGYVWFSTLAAVNFGASNIAASPEAISLPHELYEQTLPMVREHLIVTLSRKMVEQLQLTVQRMADEARVDDHAPGYLTKAERIVRDFVSFREGADAKAQLISQLHTSRLSAYGFTAQAEVLGVSRYAINEQLDGRVCPVCRLMHGKTFEVTAARQALDVILFTQNPDELKNLQSWPNQSKQAVQDMAKMSEADLVGRNWHIPPYHPRCRGLLYATGKVPDLTPNLENWKYEATAEDFSELGLEVSQQGVEAWNAAVGQHPLDVITAMVGNTPLGVLDLLKSQTLAEAVGMEAFTISTGVASFGFKGQYGGEGQSAFGMDLGKGTATLKDFDPADGASAQFLLSTMLEKLPGVGITKLQQEVLPEVSYEWALLGFVPEASQWAVMSPVVVKRLAAVRSKVPSSVYSTLLDLVQKPDPSTVTFLADLSLSVDGKPIGQLLLADMRWQGKFDLSNPDVISKALTLLGGAE